LETLVSGIAAVLTAAAFIPQAYKIIQTRETKGVSLWMHITFAVGVAFWFTLGVMLWNWPIMLANAVTFLLTVIIITMRSITGNGRHSAEFSMMADARAAAAYGGPPAVPEFRLQAPLGAWSNG
jgi:MtN3 and saliva related transmembrane protein